MVALFPEPVIPSSVWCLSPRFMPLTRLSMAFGWSPLGSNGASTINFDIMFIVTVFFYLAVVSLT